MTTAAKLTMPTAAARWPEPSDLLGQIEMDLAVWEQGIRERLRAYGEHEGHREDDGGLRLRDRGYFLDALALIPVIREACKDAPKGMLEVIDSALILGALMGCSETWSSSWHYFNRTHPDAKRGLAIKRGALYGGKRRSWLAHEDKTREYAIKRFWELHAKWYPKRSRRWIGQQVGNELGVKFGEEKRRSGKQIERWVAAATRQ